MIGGAASFERIYGDQQMFGIVEDHDGNIWFGTPSGANRYGKVEKRVVKF
jgi:hypothetical protein